MANTDDTLMTKLKNKVTYNVHNLVNDPKANEFAKQQKEKEQESATPSTDKKGQEPEQNKITKWTLLVLYYTGAFLLGWFVANDMIIYPLIIRVIFYIIIVIGCIMNPTFEVILSILYGIRFICKLIIVPTEKTQPLIKALLFPKLFTSWFLPVRITDYTENKKKSLCDVMTHYYDTLKASFFNTEDTVIQRRMEEVREGLYEMHKITCSVEQQDSNNDNVKNNAKENKE
jgi:hypothetical protein